MVAAAGCNHHISLAEDGPVCYQPQAATITPHFQRMVQCATSRRLQPSHLTSRGWFSALPAESETVTARVGGSLEEMRFGMYANGLRVTHAVAPRLFKLDAMTEHL